MRKLFFVFLASCTIFAACSKSTTGGEESKPEGVPFEKGQVCTIIAGGASAASTKMTSSYDGNKVDFLWESGDQLKLTVVGGSSTTCTIEQGGGEATAKFTVTMPSAGTLFNLQYPAETPDLSTQNYVENALPHNKMLMEVNNCSLASSSYTLVSKNAVLCLNLCGTDKTVGFINVEDLSTNTTYTLDCGKGVALSATAKPFFIVLPAGEYKFRASVYESESKILSVFETSSAQNFEAGYILDMPNKEVGNKACLINVSTESVSSDIKEFF